MIPSLLRRALFTPRITRFSIPQATLVLRASPRHNLTSPSLPLRKHISRSLSTTALRLLQSPNFSHGFTQSSTPPTPLPEPLLQFGKLQSRIPPKCPGCGAPSQTKEPKLPGYYDLERARSKAIKRMEKKNMAKRTREAEEAVWLANMGRLEQVMKQVKEKGEKGESVGEEWMAVVEDGLIVKGGVQDMEVEKLLEEKEEEGESMEHEGTAVGDEVKVKEEVQGIEAELEKTDTEILQENGKEAEAADTEETDSAILEENEKVTKEIESEVAEVEADEIIMLEPETTSEKMGTNLPVIEEGNETTPSTAEKRAEETKDVEKEEIPEELAEEESKMVDGEESQAVAQEESKVVDEEEEIPEELAEEESKMVDGEESQAVDQEESKVVDEEEEILEELSEEEESKLDAESGLNSEKFAFKTADTSAKPTTSNDPPTATLASTEPFPNPPSAAASTKLPLCERCKSLTHHIRGSPLPAYPDLDTLVELLTECKHEENHIYHLIDAADFPLSVIPRLKDYLTKYLPHKKARNLGVSYIITRADLLMPKEEQVTSLMTYLRNVLKDVLPQGEKIEDHHSPRGGRFRVISIKNGWSVRRVKAEFSHMAGLKLSKAEKGKVKIREGGIWIVGKVNVGKSRFVGEIVPEGSFTNLERVIETVSGPSLSYRSDMEILNGGSTTKISEGDEGNEELDEEELPFVSPTVSYIPGTTVAPVHVAFRHPGENGRRGGIKGEIIDLPGMERGRFLDFVRPELRRKVQMEYRVDPRQHVVKPGQSLLLAGLILIQPKTRDTDFLMYPYTALPTHVTATESALKFMNHPDPESCLKPMLYQLKPQPSTKSVEDEAKESANSGTLEEHSVPESQSREGFISRESVNTGTSEEFIKPDPNGQGYIYQPLQLKPPSSTPLPGTLPPNFKSAGTFYLTHDVTRLRNPRLHHETDAKIECLPYKVFSIDILLEGIGWVEIVAQLRTQHLMEDVIPQVEVITPFGRGVGSRAPMGADMLRLQGLQKIGKYGVRRTPTEGRPRESMKGRKSQSKIKHSQATGSRG